MPDEARDAGRGMGLTERQLLWRVELPLALPEIMAGLRIAVDDHGRPGRAGLLRRRRRARRGRSSPTSQFQSNVVVAGGLCVLLAVVLDLLVLVVQRLLTPWTRAARMTLTSPPSASSATRSSFIFTERERPAAASQVGGIAQPAAAAGST